jgi:hypothetical protein
MPPNNRIDDANTTSMERPRWGPTFTNVYGFNVQLESLFFS